MSVNRVNVDKHVNDYGFKLKQLCNSCDLAMLNGRAGGDKGIGVSTFCGSKGESTVDYVLCDKYVLKNVMQFDISDHMPYSDHKMLSFSLKAFIFVNNTTQEHGKLYENIDSFTKWKDKKKDSFLSKINEEDVFTKINNMIITLHNNVNKDTVDNVISDLSSILVEAGSEHKGKVGAVRGEKKGSPWYDEECKRDRCRFLELRLIFGNNKTDENRKMMCKQRSKYRQTCRRKKRLYNRTQAEELVSLSKTDPKKFWRVIKGNKKQTDNSDVNFYDHFKKLAKRDTNLSAGGRAEVDQLNGRGDTRVLELDRDITIDELQLAIRELKRDKAAGHDAIVNEFIINAPLVVHFLLISIFNSMLFLEYFPEIWCIGSIIPIFKSGDKGEATNYRGITLLSIVGKLFTKIMNTRLNEWAERERILTEAQFGFRKERGTTDCLFILQGLIENMLGKGNKLFAVFIDYEKAFDYLDRGAIWAKLIKGGVSSKCIRIFQSLYDKMKLEVRKNTESGVFESNAGILQGESTSPIFFSFFVNDLESDFNVDEVGVMVYDILLKLLMYADDMVIFSKTKKGLQEALDNLDVYCRKWDISVNTRKTKVVVFRKGGRLNNDYTWYFRNELIEVVSTFKYLGLHFSSTGTFSFNFSETVSTARRALFGLKKLLTTNTEILPKMQLDLFNTMVKPILLYGCEIWGFCRADPIERFYLSFLKSILCVKTSTPNSFVYGELGVYPLTLERNYRILKYWFKILRSNDTSFLKKMYNDMLLFDVLHPDKVTWVTLFKNMLYRHGFGYVWMNQSVVCEHSFLIEFKQRMYDIHLQEWETELNMTSNFRIYKQIKNRFYFEEYLGIVNKSFRIAITKIRLSSHLFYIERGRWSRPIVAAIDRTCTLCNTIEDEYHCLIECPRFINERKGCLPLVLKNRPSMFSFINFLKCSDKMMLNKLGLLCFKVMKEYKNKYLLV